MSVRQLSANELQQVPVSLTPAVKPPTPEITTLLSQIGEKVRVDTVNVLHATAKDGVLLSVDSPNGRTGTVQIKINGYDKTLQISDGHATGNGREVAYRFLFLNTGKEVVFPDPPRGPSGFEMMQRAAEQEGYGDDYMKSQSYQAWLHRY
jgi:hypothetical protein